MLTIQPNLSQRLYSQPIFRGKNNEADNADLLETEDIGDKVEITDNETDKIFEDESFDENIDENENPSQTLEDLQENIDKGVSGLKNAEQKLTQTLNIDLPPSARKILNGACLVGTGAVMGISMKFGWNKGNEILSSIVKNPAVKKFKQNLGKFGKKISELFTKFKETNLCQSVIKKFSQWGKAFADTKFGGKVCNLYKKISDSKSVNSIKKFFSKAKKVDTSKISDTTGDIVAFSTGASTTIAGAIPDKKKTGLTEKTDNEYTPEDEEEYDDIDE